MHPLSPRSSLRRSAMSRALLFLPALLTPPLLRADEVRVRELRQQRVGDTTYFRVEIAPPNGLAMRQLWRHDTSPPVVDRRPFRELPRLVLQDGKTKTVCFQLPPRRDRPAAPSLVFLGRAIGEGETRLLLH